MTKKRIGLIGFLHESNTFISEPTTYQHFLDDGLLEGEAFREKMQGTHHETAGFLSHLEEQASEFEAVPIMFSRAMPYGTITADAFQRITTRIIELLKKALPLDGVLVAPHGATVSESYPDADGQWLSQVRAVIGRDVPMVATLDPHGNLSAAMASACNAMVAYRSNPHLDQFQVGCEAADILVRTVRGEIRPSMAI
nr:M81 family metallopeptidase [Pseudomonadales bacterium]